MEDNQQTTDDYLASPVDDVDIPVVDVYNFITKRLKLKDRRHTIAIFDRKQNESITYSQLDIRINQTATLLSSAGVRFGTKVAIYLENNWQYVVTMLAVWKLGGVTVFVNNLLTSREVTKLLKLTACNILVTRCNQENHKDIFSVIKEGNVKTIFVIDDLTNTKTPILLTHDVLNSQDCKLYNMNSVKTQIPLGDTGVQIANLEDTVATILFSSGTTGLPKAVQLSQRSLVAHICQCQHPYFGYSSYPTELVSQPVSHVFGMNILLNALHRGSEVILLDRFDFRIYLDSIQKFKIPLLKLTPPIMVLFANSPLVAEYDLSSLTNVWCGAAPLSAELEHAVRERIPSVKVVRQGWGSSETNGAVTIGPCEQEIGHSHHGSAGMLLPNCLLKTVDPNTHKTLPHGETGEICVKGPALMMGYLNNTQATAEAYKDGWLHTGDVGRFHNGHLYIVDRLKELIKYNAYQVAPAELEALLLTNTSVADAAVFGVPDESAGQLPRAWIVLHHGAGASEQEIIEFVANNVAPYKKLRGGIKFVSSIPKSASGKILRRVIREQDRDDTKHNKL